MRWALGYGPRGIGLELRASGHPGLRSQDGIDGVKRPVQRSPGVGQLPSEPGALRDSGLRAAAGHTQEGTSRGLQVVQGHLQGTHVGDDSGQR